MPGLASAGIAAVILCCAGPLAASASAAGLPPQGVYEECEPVNQAQCATELAQTGGGGFRLVLNYSAWYGSASAIQTYASEAQADGLKVIWPLDDSAWRDPGGATTLLSTYPKLAANCGCSNNSGFLQFVIGLVRGLPATWGYYIGDELPPSQASAVGALAAQVRGLDPGHPLLFVGVGSSSLSTELAPFESIANVVGADVYPIGTGGTAQSVAPVASSLGRLAKASGTSSAMVLQAFSWAEYPGQGGVVNAPWPTEAEMQAMRNEALAIQPSMILWYSIYDVLRSDNPAGHWQDLVNAAFAPLPAAHGRRRSAIARLASLRRSQPRRHRRHRHHHRRHRPHHRSKRHRRKHRRHRHPRLSPLPSLNSLLLF